MFGKMWDVAAKDLRHLLRDRPALFMMFAVPLLLMGILGSVLSGAFSNGSKVTAIVPVVDQDQGSGARTLISALRSVPELKVSIHTDLAKVKKAVRNGDDDGLVIIPAGFSRALRSPHPSTRLTFYTVSNNNGVSAQVARAVVQAVVQRFAYRSETAQTLAQLQRSTTGKVDQAAVNRLAAQADQRLQQNPPIGLRTVNASGRKINAIDNTVPGYALMFALFALTAGAGSILEEKEAGTFKRLLIAPLPPYALLGGKLLAQFIQTLAQLAVLFGLGYLLFHIDLGSSLLALALLIVGTAFAATGLGFILVSFIKSQRQLRPVTTLIVLTFSALGGSWWPVSIEPQWMQTVSKVTLNSWAMQGFNGLMVFDKGFMQVLPNIVALFAYGVVCFAIARRTFRFREA
jgi:ABC-2 type transport system permease protein